MWGATKSYDFKGGIYSLSHTYYEDNPYIQLDYGTSIPGNITVIKIISRQDCCLQQTSNVNVYISATPDFKAGQMCAQGISPSVFGDTLTMLCPVVSFTTRYVTVMRNATNSVLSLQEITALYDGGLGLKVQVMTCSLWALDRALALPMCVRS
jgi:hypothetical protein